MNQEAPDSGHISKKQGLRIGYASQLPEFSSLSLEEVLLEKAPHGDEIELLTRARILLSKAQFADFSQIRRIRERDRQKTLISLTGCGSLPHVQDGNSIMATLAN